MLYHHGHQPELVDKSEPESTVRIHQGSVEDLYCVATTNEAIDGLVGLEDLGQAGFVGQGEGT